MIADHVAVLRRGLHVDHAFAAARLQAVFVDLRAFAVALLGDGEDQAGHSLFGFAVFVFAVRLLALFRSDGHAHDVVVLVQVHAANAISRTSHGADIFFVKADGQALMRGEEDDLLAVGERSADQFVVFVDADGDDAARHDVGEIFERRLLDRAVARGEEDVACLLLRGCGRPGCVRTVSPGCRCHQVANVLALARGADVGNLHRP